MKVATTNRILVDLLFGKGIKQNYWAARATGLDLVNLLRSSKRSFGVLVLRDLTRFFVDAVQPVQGEVKDRAQAAVDWLLHAQRSSPDDGVSMGYFPADTNQVWYPSYPETTGYIIPSLLDYARRNHDSAVRDAALRMAFWEAEVQMESGAVQGGPICPRAAQTPAAFNTGMVLGGWLAAHKCSGEGLFLEAAQRAAEFLANDLNPAGYFKTNGNFVAVHQVKTYNCLCAWPIYQLGQTLKNGFYLKTALTIIEAALRQQQLNGWFANNCLTRPEAPLLHTIGYTLQGVLEVGALAGREDFIEAVRRGTDPILSRIQSSGFVHGRFYSNWEPAGFSSCLTGSAQLAVVCYRLYELTKETAYCEAAHRIVNYLKGLQLMDSVEAGVKGALPGSFPILGGYMKASYPNWATKYLLDALTFQDLASPQAEGLEDRAMDLSPKP